MYYLDRIRIVILSCDMLFGITGRQTAQEIDLADRSRDKISDLQNFYSNPILVGEKNHTIGPLDGITKNRCFKLTFENKKFVDITQLASNVLPLHLKQTFPPII